MPEEYGFIALSKNNWKGISSNENINTGCLQRIAAATEIMASNYQRMEAERDMYKRWYYDSQERHKVLNRKVIAYRGVITKLKNMLVDAKAKK